MNKLATLALATILGSIAALTAQISSANDSLEFCEEKMQELEDRGADLDEMIDKLLALEAQCKGTGFYEYRLSKLYLRARKYEQSKKAMEQGLSYDTAFVKELELTKGDIHLHRRDYALAEKEYGSVVQKYPDWFAGYNFLGFAVFAQGKNVEAVEYLDQSNSLQESADSYRTLTLAHYLTGNYEMSADSLNRAYSLDESILGDRDPMVAGIRSYTELGKFEIAYGLLGTLLKQSPGLKEDQEFLKAGFFLREKMIAAGRVIE